DPLYSGHLKPDTRCGETSFLQLERAMDQEFKPGQIVPESCASLNDLVGADRHFVTTNKPAEPGNIGCQDRHQLPFDCFCRHGAASPRQYIPTAAAQSNPPGARLNGQTKRPPESGEGSLELDQDLIGYDGLCRGGVAAIDGRRFRGRGAGRNGVRSNPS